MVSNALEEKAYEYLRLNGFFLVSNFILHFDDAQPQEIDLLGIRLANSVEQTICSAGHFGKSVFFDDELLPLGDNSNTLILIAEVTGSTQTAEIRKRINKLKNNTRIKYALQRFGIIQTGQVSSLVDGKILDHPCSKSCLLRIMFVLNEDVVKSFQNENQDILFISMQRIDSFITERAKINLKTRSRHLLPRYLQNSILELLQRTSLNAYD